MNPVVFLGPSLPVADAQALLPAVYLPPAAAGDIYDVLQLGPTHIVLIDGYFDRVPSVYHKEILLALERGVRVFGASSMGALRAAELHTFGMEGSGRVFEMFRDGVLEDDDEVAVAHAHQEHGYRAVSDAMVNLRHGIARAEERGLITPATREQLLRLAKARFYPERCWPNVLADGGAAGIAPGELAALRDYVRAERPDQKRDDAVEVLRHVSTLVARTEAPRPPTFDLQRSHVLDTLFTRDARVDVHRRRAAAFERRLHRTALGRHVRAALPGSTDVLRDALRIAVLVDLAVRRQLLPERENHDAFQGLLARASADGAAGAARVVRELEDLLIANSPHTINRALPLALMRSGLLDEAEAGLTRVLDRLEELGFRKATEEHTDLDEDELLRWYEAQYGVHIDDLDQHATRLGQRRDELLGALAQLYLAQGGGAAPDNTR